MNARTLAEKFFDKHCYGKLPDPDEFLDALTKLIQRVDRDATKRARENFEGWLEADDPLPHVPDADLPNLLRKIFDFTPEEVKTIQKEAKHRGQKT